MELQIASALKQPGESFPFALEEPVGPQPFGGRVVAFEAPLSVAGRYVFDGKAVLVDGTVQTRLHSVCARCNEPFSEPLAFDFSERFVKASELGPEDESYPARICSVPGTPSLARQAVSCGVFASADSAAFPAAAASAGGSCAAAAVSAASASVSAPCGAASAAPVTASASS